MKTTTTDQPVYSVDDLNVDLSSNGVVRRILKGINLQVGRGEIIGIVGRSGTGKTTLLRVLGGLIPPTEGAIRLRGNAVNRPPREVVTVFQDYGNALLPWRTVLRNVTLPLEGSTRRSEAKSRAHAVIESVGLGGRESEYLKALSGGMQQRVQIARALVRQPEVLLMDEPFGALDAMTKASLQDILLELQSRNGTTIIFITHDLEEAIYLSDRVFVISGQPGTLTQQFDVNLARPRNQLTTRDDPRYVELRHGLAQALDLGSPR